MGKCNFPTKDGTPCQREVGGCSLHQPKRVSKRKSNKGRTAFKWIVSSIVSAITLVSGIFEYPHLKLPFSSQTPTAIVAPQSVTDLRVVVGATPSPQIQTDKTLTAQVRISPPLTLAPSEQLLTADSVVGKVGHSLPPNILATDQIPSLDSSTLNISQPSNAFAGIGGQLSLPQSVGLTEKYPTMDSVTGIVNQQLGSNLINSQQIPTLASVSYTEADKTLSDWLKTQGIPTLTSVSFNESSNQSPDWLKAQGIPTLTSVSPTAASPAASGTLGIQQFAIPNSFTGSPDNRVIPQSLNPVVQ